MKKISIAFLIATLSFSPIAWSQQAPDSELIKQILEKQEDCQSFVRYDAQNLYLGFGSYKNGFEDPREPVPGVFRIVSFADEKQTDFTLPDSPVDVVTRGGTAFVLTYTAIVEIDLGTRAVKNSFKTYYYDNTQEYKEHAAGFAVYGDKIVIAHGRLGVSVFDMKSRRISNQFRLLKKQIPLESMATSVTIQGQYAYVLMDNFSIVQPGEKPAFRGVIIIDMNTETVVAELDGIDPGADAVLSDSKSLIISYYGLPIWKYNMADLKGSQMPSPRARIWKFPVKGHPTGKPSMDSKYYYTCFAKHPDKAGLPVTKVPLALNRKALMLD
jgi:hypothetical protein